MSTGISADDMAEIRKQGDLGSLFATLLGRPPRQEKRVEDDAPSYHIPYRGAWPCGTSRSGPVPGPACTDCTTHTGRTAV